MKPALISGGVIGGLFVLLVLYFGLSSFSEAWRYLRIESM